MTDHVDCALNQFSLFRFIRQSRPNFLKTQQARKVVRNYNKVSQVLMEYEMLYYRAWVKGVEVAHEGK